MWEGASREEVVRALTLAMNRALLATCPNASISEMWSATLSLVAFWTQALGERGVTADVLREGIELLMLRVPVDPTGPVH